MALKRSNRMLWQRADPAELIGVASRGTRAAAAGDASTRTLREAKVMLSRFRPCGSELSQFVLERSVARHLQQLT